MSFEWLHLRNPDSSNYSLTERQAWIRLKGSAYSLYDWESPTFIARRQEHFNFSAATLIDFNPIKPNEEAGLTVMMDNRFHYDFFITSNGKQRTLNLRYTLDSLNQLYKQIVLPRGNVELQVTGDKRNYTFSYKINNGIATKIGTLNTRFLGTEVSGGYNGVVIGLYATGNGIKSTAVADFDWFEYKPL